MAQIEVTEESLRTAVDEAVFAQAVTLADKVAGFSAVGPQIEAIVDGIEVSVRVSASGLDARCACPAPYREGAPCPHAVAAVLTWLRAGPDPAAGLRAGLDDVLAGLAAEAADCDPDDLAEAVAEQLAARWGVVFRDLLTRENLAVPWREVLWALRRMEARGTICGGRFVHGFSGEQFAHPDAVGLLREVRKRPRTGETVTLSAADPLNLAGIVLLGTRVPAVATNTVTYVDGALEDQGAVESVGFSA